jgi:lysophospholipase L1-like esterase
MVYENSVTQKISDSVLNDGIINRGNTYRIINAMRLAMVGLPVTIGFIGGSITQGAMASNWEKDYVHLVDGWWRRQFPGSSISLINAGMGASSSQVGAARVQTDLLDHAPNFVVVDFSVNDANADKFKETFEGLVRKILLCDSEPGVIILNNIEYDNGFSSQPEHSEVGIYYDLPVLSMRESFYVAMRGGLFALDEISPDGLHPNDIGHELLADLICHYLNGLYMTLLDPEMSYMLAGEYEIPRYSLTPNRFVTSARHQNYNASPIAVGFEADETEQAGIWDSFKRGWVARKAGSSLTFEFRCSAISVQYKRCVHHPAPIARAVIDGNEAKAVILDGNYDQDWGDCLFLTDVNMELPLRKHTLKIEIIDAEAPVEDFYVVSVITLAYDESEQDEYSSVTSVGDKIAVPFQTDIYGRKIGADAVGSDDDIMWEM